jgi:AcrR family transcriptional regulator
MTTAKKTSVLIVEGAARIFSDKGYEGATTREIAEAAGVNEVTLFRHFGTKKSLFLAVIERFSALSGLEEAIKGRLSGDLRPDLTILGTHFLKTIMARRKPIIMSLHTADHLPEIRELIARTPQQQNKVLGNYFREQMKRGLIRTLPDPELAAQAFFGMLFESAIRQWLMPDNKKHTIKEVVSAYVDIFTNGILNREEYPVKKKGAIKNRRSHTKTEGS